MKFCMEQIYKLLFTESESKGAGKAVPMRRLVCAFVVRIQHSQVFSRRDPCIFYVIMCIRKEKALARQHIHKLDWVSAACQCDIYRNRIILFHTTFFV